MIAKYVLSFILNLFCVLSFCQISVVNPSFEDTPSDATVPKGWLPCQDGTTPDILPGFWGEYNEANHGSTYVGMITRENGTFESIGQRLSEALQKGGCYKFSIDLSHGQVYSGYKNPIKLRIYLGKDKCDRSQLIYESKIISNEDWEKHIIEFHPNKAYDYIILEAFYKEGSFNYKGNVLIDNLSSIRYCGKA